MSYASLDTATRDESLKNRTIAAVQQEARENPTVADTDYAALVIANSAEGAQMIWPVALNTEAEYESALAAGNPNPGGDPSVITDGMILSAVQSSWPSA
jgi:hypothetical protein